MHQCSSWLREQSLLFLILDGLFYVAHAASCGEGPVTHCEHSHTCCAIDSGDPFGFCCPNASVSKQTVQCAFGIDGLGTGIQELRNCCFGRPVCGVGVGARYCCMGPASKRSASGCSAHGPPICCNHMCGDELCDIECKWLGGTCIPGLASEGGMCMHTQTGWTPGVIV